MMNGPNGDRLPGPKFPFGRVVVTPGVLEKLDRPKIDELLRRHGELDPGTPPDEDVKERELSLREGLSIHSSFEVKKSGKLPHYGVEVRLGGRETSHDPRCC